METIGNFDRLLLLLINGSHNVFQDHFFMAISNKYLWIPLYILLAAIFLKKLGIKNGIIVIIAMVISVTITDLVSSKLIKVYFERPRPCHSDMAAGLWLPAGCGGLYGFISSHAANTMGIAVLCINVLTKNVRGKLAGFFAFILVLYALLNGYSRIYLGVHYPTDVLAGMVFGMIVGGLLYFILRRSFLKDK